MEIKGKIHSIKETTTHGANNFKKRKLILDRSQKEQFGDRIFANFNEVTFIGEEKVKLPDNFEAGDIVTLHIDIRGNFFTDPNDNIEKFSQEINCWKIDLVKKKTGSNPSGNDNSVYNA